MLTIQSHLNCCDDDLYNLGKKSKHSNSSMESMEFIEHALIDEDDRRSQVSDLTNLPVSPLPQLSPIKKKKRNLRNIFRRRQHRLLDRLVNSQFIPTRVQSPGEVNSDLNRSPVRKNLFQKSKSKRKEDISIDIANEECLEFLFTPPLNKVKSDDWADSVLFKKALDMVDDNFPEELSKLNLELSKSTFNIGNCHNHALKLLLSVHRDLHCPKDIHDRYWNAHKIPSSGNLASVMSRLSELVECRNLLIELLKAVSGRPSPILLTRMLEEQKNISDQYKSDFHTTAEMFTNLKFFGQSSSQIRQRARVTVLTMSCNKGYDEQRHSDFYGTADIPFVPALPVAPSEIQRSGIHPPTPIQRNRKTIQMDGFSPILKPSEIIARSTVDDTSQKIGIQDKEPSFHKLELHRRMSIILEDDDNNDDVEDNTTPLISDATIEFLVARQKTIQEIVKARFSGGPIPASPQASIVNSNSKTNSSPTTINFLVRPPLLKKNSSLNIHPKLLETIAAEWIASMPWKINNFIFNGKIIVQNRAVKKLV